MNEPCPIKAGREYFSSKTENGKSISITLCLLTMPFGEKGEQLIPYKVDDKGMIWGAESYSTEVSNYEDRLRIQFRIPAADTQSLESEYTNSRKKDIIEGITFYIIGLVIFYSFLRSIGWIIRGFLGIPRGMDKRPE
jgi:hypothetical protein